MAKALDKAWSLVPATVIMAGRMAGAGTGTPTVTEGRGFTVNRQGVGVYRVVFDEFYPKVISAVASLFMGTAGGEIVQITAISTSSKHVEFTVWDTGATTPAAADLGTSDELDFVIVLRNQN